MIYFPWYIKIHEFYKLSLIPNFLTNFYWSTRLIDRTLNGSRVFLPALLKEDIQSCDQKRQTEKWMSVDRHHRNSINVRIDDFVPVFWIAARIKCLTLLDHVASWRSPEGGRAYIGERTERNRCRWDRDSESATETERERKKNSREKREWQ